MASNDVLWKLFSVVEHNNHGPMGPSTYSELEIEVECSDEDYEALHAFLLENFAGEYNAAEDFDQGMFNKILGKHLPDNVDNAGSMLLAIARSYKHLGDENPIAEEVVQGLLKYKSVFEEEKELENKRWKASVDVYQGLQKLEKQCKSLTKEDRIRLVKEQIEMEEAEIKNCSSRVTKSREKLVELNKQLDELYGYEILR